VSAPIGQPAELATAIRDRITGTDSDSDGFPTVGDVAGQFGSWAEFEEFLHHPKVAQYIEPQAGYQSLLIPNGNVEGITGMNVTNPAFVQWWRNYFQEIYIDLLMANFNPNSRLNDFNPDRHIRQHVDKAQLTKYTTEFCFEEMTGSFEIQSLGIVAGPDGTVKAQAEIKTVTELWTPYRVSTQAQFMQGFSPDPNGDGSIADNNLAQILGASGAINLARRYSPTLNLYWTALPISCRPMKWITTTWTTRIMTAI
jgi:hypothetical protein